jgi:hypothetical protein
VSLCFTGAAILCGAINDGIGSKCIAYWFWTTWLRIFGQMVTAVVSLVMDGRTLYEERRDRAKNSDVEELREGLGPESERVGYTTGSFSHATRGVMLVGAVRRNDASGST